MDRQFVLEDNVERIIKVSRNPDKYTVLLVDKNMIFGHQIRFPQFKFKNTNAR